MIITKKLNKMVEAGYLTKEAADNLNETRKEMWKTYLLAKCGEYAMGKEAMSLPGLPKANEIAKLVIKQMVRDPKFTKTISASVGQAIKRSKPTGPMDYAKLALTSALLGAGASAAQKGIELGGKAMDEAKMGGVYKEMYKEFPEFKGNEAAVNKMYGVLKTFAPKIALNPITAGSFIKTQLGQKGMVQPEILSRIAKVQETANKMGTSNPLTQAIQTFPTMALKA